MLLLIISNAAILLLLLNFSNTLTVTEIKIFHCQL